MTVPVSAVMTTLLTGSGDNFNYTFDTSSGDSSGNSSGDSSDSNDRFIHCSHLKQLKEKRHYLYFFIKVVYSSMFPYVSFFLHFQLKIIKDGTDTQYMYRNEGNKTYLV